MCLQDMLHNHGSVLWCRVRCGVLNFRRYYICTLYLSIITLYSIITQNNTTPCNDIIKHVCINYSMNIIYRLLFCRNYSEYDNCDGVYCVQYEVKDGWWWWGRVSSVVCLSYRDTRSFRSLTMTTTRLSLPDGFISNSRLDEGGWQITLVLEQQSSIIFDG